MRFAVIGTSGSGKTTTGRELARRLRLPFVELDALVHGPDWAEASDDDLREAIGPMLAADRWVIDGNYQRKLGDLVLEHADTVVWLDLALAVKFGRTFRRTVGRLARRQVLWNGNRETVRNAFFARDSLFVWLLRSHWRHRRELPTRLAQGKLAHLEVVRLRSPAGVRRWLSAQGPSQ